MCVSNIKQKKKKYKSYVTGLLEVVTHIVLFFVFEFFNSSDDCNFVSDEEEEAESDDPNRVMNAGLITSSAIGFRWNEDGDVSDAKVWGIFVFAQDDTCLISFWKPGGGDLEAWTSIFLSPLDDNEDEDEDEDADKEDNDDDDSDDDVVVNFRVFGPRRWVDARLFSEPEWLVEEEET